MPRAPVATLLSLSRRGYAAAAAGAEVHQRAAAMAARGSASAGVSNSAAASREVFWMRDPQTGCWAPEDRFADVDAAELRARLLSRKD
ncbi:hypothetical protein PAHAL_1G273000 [Panicum hallii]|uniref:Uncharacterized protein n=1 Tax=Panicum hallii TaxID=206008 RepID=A0A2S3GQG3_9POAL|nr:protein SENESCENCE-ASSOCIATED GENE 21, mitochondrial-like [Panicum hallii]PAN06569.1 hypothetical protein PAHAL_1G273000 [Panicum hallii]